MKMAVRAIVLLFVCVLCSACGQGPWLSGSSFHWNDGKAGQAEFLYSRAYSNFEKASTLTELLEVQEDLEAVIAIEPTHKEALAYLGNLHILLGAAYTLDRTVKRDHFRQSRKYCERAMLTNTAFREAVKDGANPWESAMNLEGEDAPAMLFWVTALQYEFKEGMTIIEKILNIQDLRVCLAFLDRISLTAPKFGGGAVQFAYAVSYSAPPSFLGGDKELGRYYLDRALIEGKGYLMPVWGKGKYYHQVTGDMENARRDLLWVARQDPDHFHDFYPWRLYFIADAEKELALLAN
ncbi:MAG: TRAP transporter TatT component family protein [Desulfopila sp.]|jgi:hypothetical protein|nr:TRAP transporter TatT component family protein [Desulfopila sp.]